MKKIISLLLMFLLVFSFTFTSVTAEEPENVGTPDLEKATLLSEESTHFITEINPLTFDDSSEHSPYGGYTLDYESGMFGEYSSYYVTIGTHLFVKWIQGRGQTYFLQMTISMNKINLDYQYIPKDISKRFDYAESNITLNTKQYRNEDFYASLFTDQNTIIVKDRQWMDFSYDYNVYNHDYTTRTGLFFNYKYNHFYNKENHLSHFSETDNNKFIFRGGNSVLYNFDFSSIIKGPQSKKKTDYNRNVINDIILYNSIGIAFTSEIALNTNDTKFINASGEFVQVSDKINWSSIGISFPAGISINPADLINKEYKEYRATNDLQWEVIPI